MLTQPIDLFRLLGDETRLRCLALLAAHGELCVCELTQVLGVSQPKISRHLATLRESGLVSDRRLGVWVYYRLRTDLSGWAQRILGEAVAGSRTLTPYRHDHAALKGMTRRRGVNGARQADCA
jgi:ArsR family transcriptional regulator, arsenate/arsenite/antimonite-responsive transcriptional repressor